MLVGVTLFLVAGAIMTMKTDAKLEYLKQTFEESPEKVELDMAIELDHKIQEAKCPSPVTKAEKALSSLELP